MPQGEYILGHTKEESWRLVRQAAIVEPETEVLFRAAGITSGMHVLEIGSGAGDVAMLAGRLVRPGGSVRGIEQNADSIAFASARAAAAGLSSVHFEAGDLDRYTPRKNYDALVGRFVLPYLKDPSATLQNLAAHLNPGSIVVFLEFDTSKISSTPESQLFRSVATWMTEAFRTSIDPCLGSSLGTIFRGAGFKWPYMMSWQKTFCGPDGPYGWLADLIRAVLTHIVQHGLATEKEIDIDTLEDRMREEAVARQLTVFGPRWIGAWSRV